MNRVRVHQFNSHLNVEPSRMLSFRIHGLRFHCRSAAVIVDGGHLFLHRLEGDQFWALPGGRVEPGEEATATLHREFQEELGTSILCQDLACTGENFFTYDGEFHHELGLYFLATLPAGSPLAFKPGPHLGVEADKRLEFLWVPLAELHKLDARPKSLMQAIAAGAIPRHFVQDDRERLSARDCSAAPEIGA